MTRGCIRKVGDEFLKIDKYLEKYEKKYGTVYYGGFDYVACSPEEQETGYDGKPIYIGEAYCSDSIYVDEQLDAYETEDIDQVNIYVDLFYYERDADGNVKFMDKVGSLKWKGTKDGGYIGG